MYGKMYVSDDSTTLTMGMFIIDDFRGSTFLTKIESGYLIFLTCSY